MEALEGEVAAGQDENDALRSDLSQVTIMKK
jgi:hypothetical protein